MISREHIIELYHAILLREPEGDHIFDWWQGMNVSYNQIRAALISSEEFRILQEREQSLRSREIIDRTGFEKKFAKYFNEPDNEILPDSLKYFIKIYCDHVKPNLVVALGKSGSKLCVDYINLCSSGYTKCITNLTEETFINSVNIPMKGRALLNFLEAEDFTFPLGIVECSEDQNLILSMYKNLPDSGVLICIGNLPQDLYDKISEAKEVVWGDILKFDGYSIITRYVWPLRIDLPVEPSAHIKKGSAKIALTCIVKNEALYIESFLRINSNVADHITIIDTGSTDGTIDLAVKLLEKLDVTYNLEVIQFKGFADARNSAISAVPNHIDWILMLDADEKLTPYNMQKVIDIVEVSTVDAYALPRYNPLDSSPNPKFGRYPDRQARLFKNGSKTNAHYVGAVHEALIIDGVMEFPPINTIAIGGDLGGPHIFHCGSVMSDDKFIEKSKFYEQLSKNVS